MSDTTPSIPKTWAQVLERHGWTQEKLAVEAGVSKATVNRMVRGQGRPNAESVRKVAAVLTAGDTDAVWSLLGTGHFDYGDFPVETIADELRLLTPKQRKSLIAVVRSMSDPEGKRSGDVAPAPQKTRGATRVDKEEVNLTPPGLVADSEPQPIHDQSD